MFAFFHTLLARIWGFFRPNELESDFEMEVASHLAMAEEDGLRRGLTREEARRAARVRLGGTTQLRESWRAAWGLSWLNGFALDTRLGLRMLRRSWGVTIAGGLAMTIVITLAAVAFVFLDEFLGFTAPPLDEGERIVALQVWDAEAHLRRDVPRADIERWGANLQSVVDLGGYQTIERRLISEGRPAEWVPVAEITASGFRLTRVPPFLGRWISEADEQAGAEPVMVIGFDVWQSRFGSNRAIIGQRVRLGEIPHTVVGVMPEGFAFPVNHHYWIPLRPSSAGALKAAPGGVVFARLAPGVSLERAQAELATMGLLPPATGATSRDARRARAVPYTFAFTDDVEPGELALQHRIILLLISLLLVPPCLNIAILIYARTVTRQEEFAARFALGASRGRIVAQLCIEVFVLSAMSGAVALALTRPILAQIGDIFRRFPELNGSLPFWVDFRLSWRTAAFVAGLTVLAALIAGLTPALQATGRIMPTVLRSMSNRVSIPLGKTWTALIAAQVCLALAGLPSAVELAWGNLRPAVLGPGFAAKDFLTARLEIKPPSGATALPAFALRLKALQAEVVRQIESEPGVSAVTLATALPGAESSTVFELEGAAGAGGQPARNTFRANHVDKAFFTAYDIRALAGRTLDSRDFSAPGTVIVDQAFVRQIGGDGNALGRRVRPAAARGSEPGPWYEIVGVVSDRPANTSQGRMYFPLLPREVVSSVRLAFHTGADPAATSRRLQEIATNLDPALRLDEIRPLDEVLNEKAMASSLATYALAIVTMSVLLLSAAGLYALMSFTVTRQRREIAIRLAIGAPPSRMLAGVFIRALSQIAIGVAAGGAVSLVLHRWLDIEGEGGRQIPGIIPAATIFMLVIGVVSAAGPARRAIKVDPTEALRDG